MGRKKNSMQQSKAREAWVVFLDMYGFSAMVESCPTKRLFRAINMAHKQVKDKVCQHQYVPELFFLSDSMFLIYSVAKPEDKWPVVHHCLECLPEIIYIFAENGFPVRGGIAFGEVQFSADILVGLPVVQAVLYEKLSPIPCVLLPVRELLQGKDCDDPLVKDVDLLTLRDGSLMAGRVIYPRPIEGFLKLANSKVRKYSVTGPYNVAKVWFDALNYIMKHHAGQQG